MLATTLETTPFITNGLARYQFNWDSASQEEVLQFKISTQNLATVERC
ncbi:MAG: hypothetical protein R2795_22540 [Saprospiraceae bacterium]